MLQLPCLQFAVDFAFDRGQVNLFVGLTLTDHDFLWAHHQFLLTLFFLFPSYRPHSQPPSDTPLAALALHVI